MPLNTRDVIADFLPQEGTIDIGSQAKEKDLNIAQKAQENFALQKNAIYAPGLDEDYLKSAHREISYSFALANIYHSLDKINGNIKIKSIDDENTIKNKTDEKFLLGKFSEMLEKIFPEILKNEYPNSVAKFENGKISANLKGDPLPLQHDEGLAQRLSSYLDDLQSFVSIMKRESPNFQTTSMKYLDNYATKIADKLAGKKVVTEEKSDEDIIEGVKRNIQILIRDDENEPADKKIDRPRAVNDLVKKLSPLGMELAVIPVVERAPRDEMLSQAKTCILRAAWDGFIERPTQYNCSENLQYILNHPRPSDNKPEQYNLDKNEIWQLCEKVPELYEIKADLQKALANRGFPPEKTAELTYADMAFLICEQRQATSADVKKRQNEGKNEVDGVKLQSSGRAKFFKKYAENHGDDLKKLLEAKGVSQAEIKETLKLMKAGKSNDAFDGHHNFAINNPDIFCQVTGENWWDMNKHVVLMDKKAHDLLHSLENNVTAKGILLDKEDSKASHRTIFTDKQSGKKFYLAIRVKDGIDGLLGLHRETIYNKNYLSDNVFEEHKTHTASQQIDNAKQSNQAALHHANERRIKLNNQKSAENDANRKTENTPPKKERRVIRKDYLGLKNKGGIPKSNNLIKSR